MKKRLQSGIIRQLEKMGYQVTRNHFYSPIPDTLKSDNPVWERISDMVGIDIAEDDQVRLAESFAADYRAEYGAFAREATEPWEFVSGNESFGPVDAEIAYCMVRRFKPKRVIEVGSGASTLVMAQAIRKNGTPCELTSIEPYPNPVIRKGFPGLTRLIAKPVEEVDLSVFAELEAGDILFLDSSHVIKIGNDVQYEYLEVLPRLAPGVIVHAHDIFLPANYPKRWVVDLRLFWNEQYMLQALLAHNNRFKVTWAGHFMHMNHPDLLESVFPSYNRATEAPASFWFTRTEIE